MLARRRHRLQERAALLAGLALVVAALSAPAQARVVAPDACTGAAGAVSFFAPNPKKPPRLRGSAAGAAGAVVDRGASGALAGGAGSAAVALKDVGATCGSAGASPSQIHACLRQGRRPCF